MLVRCVMYCVCADLVFLLCILSGCLAAVLILGIALYIFYRISKNHNNRKKAWGAGVEPSSLSRDGYGSDGSDCVERFDDFSYQVPSMSTIKAHASPSRRQVQV